MDSIYLLSRVYYYNSMPYYDIFTVFGYKMQTHIHRPHGNRNPNIE